jgi:mRNA-degrading endonuclease toxin of MazEF toxin-antitoxin module
MTDDFTKDFDAWNQLKQELDGLQPVSGFGTREVWWCSIGTNIGSEQCGKGGKFLRPVLILKRISPTTFIGVSLTTKLKDRDDYYRLTVGGKLADVQLSSVRTLDARRLFERIEKLSEGIFSGVVAAFVKSFSPEP